MQLLRSASAFWKKNISTLLNNVWFHLRSCTGGNFYYRFQLSHLYTLCEVWTIFKSSVTFYGLAFLLFLHHWLIVLYCNSFIIYGLWQLTRLPDMVKDLWYSEMWQFYSRPKDTMPRPRSARPRPCVQRPRLQDVDTQAKANMVHRTIKMWVLRANPRLKGTGLARGHWGQ